MPGRKNRNKNKKKATHTAEREALQTQIITHFNEVYGKDENNVESWKQLCRDIGVKEGTSVTECKEVVPHIVECV